MMRIDNVFEIAKQLFPKAVAVFRTLGCSGVSVRMDDGTVHEMNHASDIKWPGDTTEWPPNESEWRIAFPSDVERDLMACCVFRTCDLVTYALGNLRGVMYRGSEGKDHRIFRVVGVSREFADRDDVYEDVIVPREVGKLRKHVLSVDKPSEVVIEFPRNAEVLIEVREIISA